MTPLIVLYTHTDYKDVGPVFFGQTEEYLDEFSKCIFVNEKSPGIPADYRVLTYPDTLSYTERLAHCLSKIKTSHILIQHEDMFLYGLPNIERLSSYIDVMKQHSIDCVKLLKGGETNDIPFEAYEDLKVVPKNSKWFFAIQPTIGNTQSYLTLCQNTPSSNIWEFELNGQQVFKKLSMRALYTYRGEPKRGRHHWDSVVYPYVATAIGKGRGNFGEYREELSVILSEYNIDPNIRGTF